MSKNFYIASGFKNIPIVTLIATQLETSQFKRTYDWTKNNKAVSLTELREIGEKEYQGIVDCDFFILVFPGGKGANIEFGIAMALQKPIYLYDTTDEIENVEKTCTFYFLESVTRFQGSSQDFCQMVLNSEKAKATDYQ